MKKVNLRFTNHVRKRFKERFGYKIPDGDVVKALNHEVQLSHISKMFMNNTRFMTMIYDKYGYEKKFDFRVTDDVVFVCDENVLITALIRNESVFSISSGGRFR